MKHKLFNNLLAAPLMLAPLTYADCRNAELLDIPAIPDGSTSSAEQMHEAQVEVMEFVAAGEAYISCFRPPAMYHNRIVDNLESISEYYNAELREFFQVQSGLAAK